MNDHPISIHDMDDEGVAFPIRQLIATVSESRWLVIGIVLVCLVGGAIKTYTAVPIYQTSAKLLVLQHQSAALGQLAQISSLIQGSTTPTDTQIELLRTRSILEPVVRNLALNVSVQSRDTSFFAKIFGNRTENGVEVRAFDVPQALEGRSFTIKPLGNGRYSLVGPEGARILRGEVGKTFTADLPAGRLKIRLDSLGGRSSPFSIVCGSPVGAVRRLAASLSASEAGQRTGVIGVSLRGTEPDLIARELNAILREAVAQNARRSALQAQKQLDFLKKQTPSVQKRVQRSQGALSAFLAKHPTILLSQSGGGAGNSASPGSSYLAGSVTALDTKINELHVEKSKLEALSGTQNPQIAILQAQLSTLRAQRAAAMSSIDKLPGDQQELIRLQLAATVAQNLYQAVVSQMEALQIAQAGAVGDAVIVDPATVPHMPVSPVHSKDLAVALLIGLFLGVGTAYGRRILYRGIDDPDMFETRLGLPVYAVVPHSKVEQRLGQSGQMTGPGVRLFSNSVDADDATLETLKSLRTAIQIALPKNRPRVICISSLGPEEGKSFISSNIGYLLSQSLGKTLLVDADLRRGHLNRFFGVPRIAGFADVLAGNIGLAAAIRTTPVPELDLVTTGVLPDDAATLLAKADLEPIIDELANRYELVVIDVPPVLAVSDVFSIAKHASLHLLLVRYGLHSVQQVQLILRRFERAGIKVDGAILNDVSTSAARYAYHQYGYSYQYKYTPGGTKKAKDVS